MATDTLIQYLEATDSAGNALGSAASNRRQTETFIAGGTIVAGQVVMTDISKAGSAKAITVVQASLVATGQPLAVGVALRAATAGQRVEVVVAGYVEDVDCTAGTILAGAPLSAGKTAAGEVETSAATDLAGCFAVALEAKGATTANKVAICVKKQF